MSSSVFFAVMLAAILHAAWNALVKGGADKQLAMIAVVIGHLPLACVALVFVPPPNPESYAFLVSGVALHACYQLFLLRSYQAGDLTQVYPIARGVAPLIVAFVSITVLGEQLSTQEIWAIFMIAAGILSLGIVRRHDGSRNLHAAMLAVITGCFIAAYSLVDGMGARLSGSPIGYFAWLAIGNAIIIILFALATRPALLREIPQKARAPFLIGGSASFIAYALVVWAFTQAPIALVTAMRETSIIFALIIGVFFLKERLDLAKVAAAFITLTGSVILRFSKG